jgi:hypothetical protein
MTLRVVISTAPRGGKPKKKKKKNTSNIKNKSEIAYREA